MSGVRALAWKEMRQVLPNGTALAAICFGMPLLNVALTRLAGWQDVRQSIAIGELMIAGILLGATAVAGDPAPVLEAALPMRRSVVVLVRLGVRLAAFLLIAGIAATALALVAQPDVGVIPEYDGKPATMLVPWIFAPFMAAALASAFRTRPMLAALDSLWVLLAAAIVVFPAVLPLSPEAYGWGVAALLAALAYLAALARRDMSLSLGRAVARFSVAAAAVLAALLVLWLTVGNIVGHLMLDRARRAWDAQLGPLDPRPRFPDRPANEAWHRMEVLSEPFGVPLRDGPGQHVALPPGLPGIHSLAFWPMESRDAPRTVEIPFDLAKTLAAYQSALADMRSLLNSGELPRPFRSVSMGPSAPIPRLWAHHVFDELLLADAIAASRRGDRSTALADFTAAVRFTRGLDDQPALITMLTASSEVQLQILTLRMLDGVTDRELDDLDIAGWRQRVRDSWRVDMWSYAQAADEDTDAMLHRVGFGRSTSPLSRQLARAFLAVTRPAARMTASATLRRFMAIGTADQARPDCDWLFELTPATETLSTLQVGLWQLFLPTQPQRVYRSAAALPLEAELTRVVLAARAAREADVGHAWPATLPDLASSVCPGKAWRYSVQPDGTMAIGCWAEPAPESWGRGTFVRYVERP